MAGDYSVFVDDQRRTHGNISKIFQDSILLHVYSTNKMRTTHICKSCVNTLFCFLETRRATGFEM